MCRSKIGVVLRTTAYVNVLYTAVWRAATVEPASDDRRGKYRKTPGIGTARIRDVEVGAVSQELSVPGLVTAAVDIDYDPMTVRVILLRSGILSVAQFVSLTDPRVEFGWAAALAGRTGEILGSSGITTVETSVLKSPAYRSKRSFNAHAV